MKSKNPSTINLSEPEASVLEKPASALVHDQSAHQETARWKTYIEENPLESKKSATRISLAIQDSPLKYQISKPGEPVSMGWTRTMHIPKFFSQEDKHNFEDLTHTFSVIFDKTIDAYKKDPKVRALFAFDPRIEELILRDSGYTTKIPIMRVDIFYNEDTKEWKVCEFNTDGTSAMFENDTVYGLLEMNNVWQHLHPDAEYMELCNTWVDAFLDIWKESDRSGTPSILITDILENAYRPEVEAFVDIFRNKGVSCELEDIRNLAYDPISRKLTSKNTGTAYDMVYRRAVTKDIQEHYDEVLPLIEAVKDGAVLLTGDFQTQIIHSKKINEALQNEALRSYFTQKERDFLDAHMPGTWDLNEEMVPWILEDKDKWILKPREGYAARGVWAGVDVSKEQWKKLVHDFCGQDYLVQTYIPHFKTENINLADRDHFKNYANLTGLYVYNGKFAGVYSRLADAGIISSQYNERMVPTLFLKQIPQAV